MTAKASAAPTYQVGASAGNDEAAGYQPAASVEQIRNYREVGNETAL